MGYFKCEYHLILLISISITVSEFLCHLTLLASLHFSDKKKESFIWDILQGILQSHVHPHQIRPATLDFVKTLLSKYGNITLQWTNINMKKNKCDWKKISLCSRTLIIRISIKRLFDYSWKLCLWVFSLFLCVSVWLK